MGVGPQAVVALELPERLGEAHVVQLPHCPRREPVAARLVAREALLLDHEDPVPALREPVRGGGSGRPRADDEHVDIRHGAARSVRALTAAPPAWTGPAPTTSTSKSVLIRRSRFACAFVHSAPPDAGRHTHIHASSETGTEKGSRPASRCAGTSSSVVANAVTRTGRATSGARPPDTVEEPRVE